MLSIGAKEAFMATLKNRCFSHLDAPPREAKEAFVAQLAEHWTFNPEAAGSRPAESVKHFLPFITLDVKCTCVKFNGIHVQEGSLK